MPLITIQVVPCFQDQKHCIQPYLYTQMFLFTQNVHEEIEHWNNDIMTEWSLSNTN